MTRYDLYRIIKEKKEYVLGRISHVRTQKDAGSLFDKERRLHECDGRLHELEKWYNDLLEMEKYLEESLSHSTGVEWNLK